MEEQTAELDPNSALIARYLATRDNAAFAELVRRFGPMVLGVARRLLAFHEDADDATQLVFAELARRAGTIEDPSQVGSWLHTVTVRVAHRLRQRRPDTEPLATDPIDPRLNLDDLGRRSDLEILSEELDNMPAAWREPLLLRYFAGLSNADAAAQLGTTERAYAGRLKRGRNSLRVRLLRRGVGPAAVLAMIGPAAMSAEADHWDAITDSATELAADPSSLTFLPPEPSGMTTPLLSWKTATLTGAAAIVFAMLGGSGERTGPTFGVSPISTVVAEESPPDGSASAVNIGVPSVPTQDPTGNSKPAEVASTIPPWVRARIERGIQPARELHTRLLFFHTPGDGPSTNDSEAMQPVIRTLASQFSPSVDVEMINTEVNRERTRQFRIQETPTVVLLHNGQEFERFVGKQAAETLAAAVRKTLAQSNTLASAHDGEQGDDSGLPTALQDTTHPDADPSSVRPEPVSAGAGDNFTEPPSGVADVEFRVEPAVAKTYQLDDIRIDPEEVSRLVEALNGLEVSGLQIQQVQGGGAIAALGSAKKQEALRKLLQILLAAKDGMASETVASESPNPKAATRMTASHRFSTSGLESLFTDRLRGGEVDYGSGWTRLVDKANKQIFRPNGSELQFVTVEATGTATIEFPGDVPGVIPLFQRFLLEEEIRGNLEDLSVYRARFERMAKEERGDRSDSDQPSWAADRLLAPVENRLASNPSGISPEPKAADGDNAAAVTTLPPQLLMGLIDDSEVAARWDQLVNAANALFYRPNGASAELVGVTADGEAKVSVSPQTQALEHTMIVFALRWQARELERADGDIDRSELAKQKKQELHDLIGEHHKLDEDEFLGLVQMPLWVRRLFTEPQEHWEKRYDAYVDAL